MTIVTLIVDIYLHFLSFFLFSDDFPETVGVARIIQALHAHTWPNLVMKSKWLNLHKIYF